MEFQMTSWIPASFSKVLFSKSLMANFFEICHSKITMYMHGMSHSCVVIQ